MQAEFRAFLTSLESEPSYSESTRQAYANDLTRYLEFLKTSLHRLPEISDFQPQTITSFLQYESLAGKKTTTLLRRRAALHLFSTFLSVNGYLSPYLEEKSAPGEHTIAQPSPPAPQHLTAEEIEATLAVIQGIQKPTALRDSAILVLLLHSGLTTSRLTSLDIEDVNLVSRKLRLYTGRNRASFFHMDFPAHYLEDYMKEGRPNLNPLPGETALFISQMGSRLTRQGVWQILKHWGQLSGTSHRLTPRAIHNTAALNLAEAGLPLAQIQILLGHSNPKSTLALLHRLNAPKRD